MASQVDQTQNTGVSQQTQNTVTSAHNQTPARTNNNADHVDASKLTPSQMGTHLGPPSIEHDYPEDSTHRRHSVSHQEQHYMR